MFIKIRGDDDASLRCSQIVQLSPDLTRLDKKVPRIEAHGAKACAMACHGLFDPPGFAFENYDGVGSYRTTEVDDRHPLTRVLDGFRGDRRFSSITLGPFSVSDHRSFLESMVGGTEMSDSLVKRLFEATKGNPFFTKELIRSLVG